MCEVIGDSKINILQVIPEFGLAGAETMCESLCGELHRSGKYNVIVVSLYDFHSSITERMEAKGIPILYLNKRKGVDFSIIRKLVSVMIEYKIEIVHTHLYIMQYAIPAAIIAGVKVRVHTIHNIADKEFDFKRQILARLFYKLCKVIPVSISPLVQQSVMKRYSLIAERTPVVYNGIDLSKCQIKETYSPNEVFTFVHIGRFCPQKNHSVIIDAAQKLKESGYKFVITLIGGAGDELDRMVEVKNKGLSDVISFKGLQSDVFPFLEQADCFILPSLYEGMPISLIEAMGCGLPIIASAVGGIPDMIKDGESGLLIKPRAGDLFEAMVRMMDDDSLREKVGRNALAESRRFTSSRMYFGYDNIYQTAYDECSFQR